MDSSSLLALEESNFFGYLWLLPLPAGEPRQLRNVVAQDAGFTPDGHLIFSKDTSLFISEKDGRILAGFVICRVMLIAR